VLGIARPCRIWTIQLRGGELRFAAALDEAMQLIDANVLSHVRPEDYKHLTGQIIPVVMLTTERVDGKGAFLKFKVRICARGDKHYLGVGMCCWFLANLEVGGNITNCCHSSDDSKLGMCCWFLANVGVGGSITNCCHSRILSLGCAAGFLLMWKWVVTSQIVAIPVMILCEGSSAEVQDSPLRFFLLWSECTFRRVRIGNPGALH
jgi:hypothetical protein